MIHFFDPFTDPEAVQFIRDLLAYLRGETP